MGIFAYNDNWYLLNACPNEKVQNGTKLKEL